MLGRGSLTALELIPAPSNLVTCNVSALPFLVYLYTHIPFSREVSLVAALKGLSMIS